MPVNKYALLRYRIIHRCLSNPYHPYPGREFLRQQCEEALYGSSDGSNLSVKTLERDLRDMRDDDILGYHAPILFSREHQGYYYADPAFDIDKKPLSDEEAEALIFAANTLFQFRDTPIFQHYSFAIEKIFEQLHFHTDEGKGPSDVVQFESAPWSRGTDHLPSIYRAIRAQQKIAFSHRKYSDQQISHRILDPYLLKEYRNRWYVIGKEGGKERVQSFGLDRITDLRVLEELFVRAPHFEPESFFRHTLGITEAGLSPEQIVLSFSPMQGNYLKSQPLHHSQKVLTDNGDEFRITLQVSVTWELVQLILGYGSEVEVIAPLSVRTAVAERLRDALNKY